MALVHTFKLTTPLMCHCLYTVLWLRLFLFFDLVVLFMQRPKYKKLIFK